MKEFIMSIIFLSFFLFEAAEAENRNRSLLLYNTDGKEPVYIRNDNSESINPSFDVSEKTLNAFFPGLERECPVVSAKFVNNRLYLQLMNKNQIDKSDLTDELIAKRENLASEIHLIFALNKKATNTSSSESLYDMVRKLRKKVEKLDVNIWEMRESRIHLMDEPSDSLKRRGILEKSSSKAYPFKILCGKRPPWRIVKLWMIHIHHKEKRDGLRKTNDQTCKGVQVFETGPGIGDSELDETAVSALKSTLEAELFNETDRLALLRIWKYDRGDDMVWIHPDRTRLEERLSVLVPNTTKSLIDRDIEQLRKWLASYKEGGAMAGDMLPSLMLAQDFFYPSHKKDERMALACDDPPVLLASNDRDRKKPKGALTDINVSTSGPTAGKTPGASDSVSKTGVDSTESGTELVAGASESGSESIADASASQTGPDGPVSEAGTEQNGLSSESGEPTAADPVPEKWKDLAITEPDCDNNEDCDSRMARLADLQYNILVKHKNDMSTRSMWQECVKLFWEQFYCYRHIDDVKFAFEGVKKLIEDDSREKTDDAKIDGGGETQVVSGEKVEVKIATYNWDNAGEKDNREKKIRFRIEGLEKGFDLNKLKPYTNNNQFILDTNAIGTVVVVHKQQKNCEWSQTSEGSKMIFSFSKPEKLVLKNVAAGRTGNIVYFDLHF